MPKLIDLTGQTFGRLYVLERVEDHIYPSGFPRARYHCLCDCGNETTVLSNALRGGDTQSCGCLQTDAAIAAHWHGHEDITGTFWRSVRHNAKTRGMEFNITIEYAWELFLAQEKRCALSGVLLVMDNRLRQSQRLRDIRQTASLDRIDSKLGYQEGNVQWLHKKLNKIKWELSQAEFKAWCRLVHLHSVSRNEEDLLIDYLPEAATFTPPIFKDVSLEMLAPDVA